MADVSEFTKATGDFLKADKVGKELVVQINGEAEVVRNETYNTDRLHIPVLSNGNQFTFDCSKTNARTISKTLGNDTASWNGKELVLETYRTKTSDGKMVDAINVKSVKV